MELQGVMMGHHEEDLVNTRQTVECLTASQFKQIGVRQSLRHQRQPPPIIQSHEPRVKNAGEPNICRFFIIQCEVVFSLQPRSYASERSKVVTSFLC